MCLHGTNSSGQLHDIESSLAELGNKDTPTPAKTSSMFSGISPERSFAEKSAWVASSLTASCHFSSEKGSIAISTM